MVTVTSLKFTGGECPDFPSKITLNDLYRLNDLVWYIRNPRVPACPEYSAFDEPFGNKYKTVNYSILCEKVKEVYTCKKRIASTYKDMPAIHERLNKLSCGNYIVHKLPWILRNRHQNWQTFYEMFAGTFSMCCPKELYALVINGKKNAEILAVEDAAEGVVYGEVTVTIADDSNLDDYLFQKYNLVSYSAKEKAAKAGRISIIKLQLIQAFKAICCALGNLEQGGSLVIQTFALESIDWVPIFYILYCTFECVLIKKPVPSPKHSDEIFLVATGFLANDLCHVIHAKLKDYIKIANIDLAKGCLPISLDNIPEWFVMMSLGVLHERVEFQRLFLDRGLAVLTPTYESKGREWEQPFNAWIAKWKTYMAVVWITSLHLPEKYGDYLEGFDLRVGVSPIVQKRLKDEDKSNLPAISIKSAECTVSNIKHDLQVYTDDPDFNYIESKYNLFRVTIKDPAVVKIENLLYSKFFSAAASLAMTDNNNATTRICLSWFLARNGLSIEEIIDADFNAQKMYEGCRWLYYAAIVSIIKCMLYELELGGSLFINLQNATDTFCVGIIVCLARIFRQTSLVFVNASKVMKGVLFYQRFENKCSKRTAEVLYSLNTIEKHYSENVPVSVANIGLSTKEPVTWNIADFIDYRTLTKLFPTKENVELF